MAQLQEAPEEVERGFGKANYNLNEERQTTLSSTRMNLQASDD